MSDGDLPRAEQQFLRAIELGQDVAESHRFLAILMNGQERWKEVAAHLQESISCGLDDPLTRELLARVFVQTGDYAEAVEEAKTGANLAPNAVGPRIVLVGVLKAAERYHEAIQAVEVAVVETEPRAILYQEAAEAALALGQNARAAEFYQQAMENSRMPSESQLYAEALKGVQP